MDLGVITGLLAGANFNTGFQILVKLPRLNSEPLKSDRILRYAELTIQIQPSLLSLSEVSLFYSVIFTSSTLLLTEM